MLQCEMDDDVLLLFNSLKLYSLYHPSLSIINTRYFHYSKQLSNTLQCSINTVHVGINM